MELNGKFEQALLLASDLHQNQIRKGSSIPYLSHLLGVTSIALRFGASEDEAIAALLHDAVEDQGGAPTLKKIEDQFGNTVARIVMGCSDSNQTPKPPWHQRKQTYLNHLMSAEESIVFISAADKLYNAQDCIYTHHEIQEQLWNLFSAPKEDTKWYYRSLAEIYQSRKMDCPRIAPLLNEVISTIEELLMLP